MPSKKTSKKPATKKIDPAVKLKTQLKEAQAEVNRLLTLTSQKDQRIETDSKDIARLEARDQQNVELIEKLTLELRDVKEQNVTLTKERDEARNYAEHLRATMPTATQTQPTEPV